MTVFIAIASLLVVITVALLFMPLLRSSEKKQTADAGELSMQVLREQMQDLEQALAAGQIDAAAAEKERRELERRALEENTQGEIVPMQPLPQGGRQRKWFIVYALVMVPLVAGGLYWLLGNPDAMSPEGIAQADHAQQAGHSLTPQQIEAMTARLAERLAANPADGEGWMMLARSYAMLGRHGESAAAFGRALAVLPPNAGLYADYADVLAMAQGRRLAGEPEKIIAKALELDPTHIKALALSGSVGYEVGDYRRAVSDWQKILLLVPAESSVAQNIRNSIADAQSRLGTSVPVASTPVAAAAPSSARISGTVSIAPEIAASISPNDTVFVFARAVEGSRMPLALRKMTVAQLPSDFTLDDSMAMAANANLSSVKQVVVGARISKSGGAMPRPGDFEGFTQPVTVGGKNVKVVISSPVK